MTLAKVFSKTDRWLGAKVQRRNTERQRRRRRKKEKTVEWGRTAAREFLLMSVRRRARENSDTSSAGVKNIHPVNDCARLGRIVSSSSSPPKTLLSISLSSVGLFLFGFLSGVKWSLCDNPKWSFSINQAGSTAGWPSSAPSWRWHGTTLLPLMCYLFFYLSTPVETPKFRHSKLNQTELFTGR